MVCFASVGEELAAAGKLFDCVSQPDTDMSRLNLGQRIQIISYCFADFAVL